MVKLQITSKCYINVQFASPWQYAFVQITFNYYSLSVTEYFPFLKYRSEVNLCMILDFHCHT